MMTKQTKYTANIHTLSEGEREKQGLTSVALTVLIIVFFFLNPFLSISFVDLVSSFRLSSPFPLPPPRIHTLTHTRTKKVEENIWYITI